MSHDKTKVLLGTTRSNEREVSCHDSDPATYKAGLCVSRASTGALSLLKSAGGRIGVSLGRDLSDAKKTSVLRTGEGVPVLASLKRSTGTITVTSYANLLTTTPDSVTIGSSVFVAQSGAATPGTLFFRAATDNTATALSLATQINAHATASTLVYAVASGAVVTLYSIVEGAGSGNDVAVAYTDNGGGNIGITLAGLSGGKLSGGSDTYSSIGYATVGTNMYINDVTGKADIAMSGFSTISNAIYMPPSAGATSAAVQGINEDSSIVSAVLVDMVGGL